MTVFTFVDNDLMDSDEDSGLLCTEEDVLDMLHTFDMSKATMGVARTQILMRQS